MNNHTTVSVNFIFKEMIEEKKENAENVISGM